MTVSIIFRLTEIWDSQLPCFNPYLGFGICFLSIVIDFIHNPTCESIYHLCLAEKFLAFPNA